MRKKYEIVITVIGLILFCYAEGWGTDWRWFASISYSDYFYDAQGITRQPNGMSCVWYKRILNDEDRIDYVAKFGEKYKDMEHVIALLELDCKGKRSRYLNIIYYSKEGKVIESDDLPQGKADWKYIIPDTVGEKLFNIVCK